MDNQGSEPNSSNANQGLETGTKLFERQADQGPRALKKMWKSNQPKSWTQKWKHFDWDWRKMVLFVPKLPKSTTSQSPARYLVNLYTQKDKLDYGLWVDGYWAELKKYTQTEGFLHLRGPHKVLNSIGLASCGLTDRKKVKQKYNKILKTWCIISSFTGLFSHWFSLGEVYRYHLT